MLCNTFDEKITSTRMPNNAIFKRKYTKMFIFKWHFLVSVNGETLIFEISSGKDL